MNVFRILLTILTLPIYNHWKVRVLMKWKCSFDKSLALDGKVTTVATTVGSVSYFSRSAFSSIIFFKILEIHGRETFVLLSQDLYLKCWTAIYVNSSSLFFNSSCYQHQWSHFCLKTSKVKSDCSKKAGFYLHIEKSQFKYFFFEMSFW